MCYPCYKATNELVLSLSLLPLLQSDECTCSLSLSYPCYKATNALVLSLSLTLATKRRMHLFSLSLSYPCYKATKARVFSLSLSSSCFSNESKLVSYSSCTPFGKQTPLPGFCTLTALTRTRKLYFTRIVV